MLWAVLIVLGLAIFSYPGGPASVSGTSWAPFAFWCFILAGLIAFSRLA